jgi:hypothetical protein
MSRVHIDTICEVGALKACRNLGTYLLVPVLLLFIEMMLKAGIAHAAAGRAETARAQVQRYLLKGLTIPSGFSLCLLGWGLSILVGLNRDELREWSWCLDRFPTLSLICSLGLCSVFLALACILAVYVCHDQFSSSVEILDSLLTHRQPHFSKFLIRLRQHRRRKPRALLAGLGLAALYCPMVILFGT